MFAEQSEEAIAAGAFHNDVVAVANERVLFAHEQAFADRDALIADCERLVPGFEFVEVPAAEVPLADAISSYLFNAQLVTPPDGEMTLIVPTEARETPSVWALARAASRRQRPDPPGRGRRRPPVDGQRRRAGLPAAARRRRSGDVDPRFLVDDAKLDRSPKSFARHWPAEIDNDDLQTPALIRDVEAARAALLDALDLTELA